MFIIKYWINGIEQLQHSGYHNRDDALHKINTLWEQRQKMFRELGIRRDQRWVEFVLASDDGKIWPHDQLLQEIQTRMEFREPPRIR